MAVGRDVAVAVEVVEEDVFPREAVMIGRDLLAVDREVRIAIAERFSGGVLHIAKHLVVSAVFLDDENDVFNRAGVANAGGNDAVAGNRRTLQVLGAITGVAADLLGVSGHLDAVRARNKGDAAFEKSSRAVIADSTIPGMGIFDPGGIAGRGGEAFAVADEQELMIGRDGDSSGIPAGRDESIYERDFFVVTGGVFHELAGDVRDHDAVLIGIGHEQTFAVG